MKRIHLRSIPEPEPNTRAVFFHKGPGTVVMYGDGDTTFVCASCESALAENVWELQIRNIVLVCAACGAFNELP
jgi:hypothetical protein